MALNGYDLFLIGGSLLAAYAYWRWAHRVPADPWRCRCGQYLGEVWRYNKRLLRMEPHHLECDDCGRRRRLAKERKRAR